MRTVVDHYINTGSTVTFCALDISKPFDRVNHFALLDLLLDRKLTNNFIAIFYNRLFKCQIYVRWGMALSFPFSVRAGVRRRHTVTGIIGCVC